MEELRQAAGAFLEDRWAQLVVAFLFAGVGAYITGLRNRRKTADRIATELIATHVAMLERAFPLNGWRQGDPRHAWMLEPYVRRVDFLKHLAKDSGLSTEAVAYVRQYEEKLGNFIETWATSQRRGKEFRAVLDTLTQSLRSALQALGRLHKHRNDPVWTGIETASERQAQEAGRAALDAGPQGGADGAPGAIEARLASSPDQARLPETAFAAPPNEIDPLDAPCQPEPEGASRSGA